MKKYGLLTLILLFSSLTFAQLTQNWAAVTQAPLNIKPRAVHVDNMNNVIVTGEFYGTVDLDPGPGVATFTGGSSTGSAFIQKFDPTGNLIWARALDGDPEQWGTAVTADNAGNIYWGGDFDNTTDLNPGPGVADVTALGFSDAFLIKLAPDGSYLWHKVWGSSSDDSIDDIEIDGAGNIIVSGYFAGSFDLDPGLSSVFAPVVGSFDIFFVKLDGSGNFIWGHTFGSDQPDFQCEIALNDMDEIYLCGYFESITDFDPSTVGTSFGTSLGANDVYVSKFDPDGNFMWHKTTGGLNDDFGWDIEIDSYGNPIIVGSFEGTVDFDPAIASVYNVTSAGIYDGFVWKLTEDGNLNWIKVVKGGGVESIEDMFLDANDHIYLSGRFYGSPDFDPGPGTATTPSYGGYDSFYIRLAADGTYHYHFTVGSTGSEWESLIAKTGDGQVILISEFLGDTDIDPTPDGTDSWSVMGGSDYFVEALCEEVHVSITEYACDSYVSPSGLYTWTTSGTYNDTLSTIVSGCDSILTITLNIYTSPSVNAGPDQNVCEGDTIVLNGTGTAVDSLYWSLDVTNGVPFVPSSGTTPYILIGTNVAGCVGVDTVLITVNAGPVLTTSPDQAFCLGDSITLTVSGADTYSWDGGSSLTDSYTLTPVGDTTVIVEGMDASGCSTLADVQLTIEDMSGITVTDDLIACPGELVYIEANGGASYFWTGPGIDNPESQGQEVLATGSVYYYVEITTTAGCKVMDSVLVAESDSLECPINISYNVITPNGDGYNDYLHISGIEQNLNNTVEIFNRWGDVIIKLEGYDNTVVRWDGKNRFDSPVEPGTYYIVLTIDGKSYDATFIEVMGN